MGTEVVNGLRRLCSVLLLFTSVVAASSEGQAQHSPFTVQEDGTLIEPSKRGKFVAQDMKALIKESSRDANAWIDVARRKRAAGDLSSAIEAARKANAYADSDEERYSAAFELAACNFQLERKLYAQFWLRRAAQVAPTEELQNRAVRYFRAVRSKTPWQFNLNSSIVPSSNVNNGSSAEIFELFGLPFVLSGDAQALSGVEFTLSGTAIYRFSGFGGQPAALSFGGAMQRVALSSEAKKLAPEASGSDYSFDAVELGFSQVVSEWGKASVLRVNTLVGHNEYGGQALTNYARLGLLSQWVVGSQSVITASGSVERQHRFDDYTRSAWVYRTDFRRAWQLSSRGDVVGFTLGLRDTSSDSAEVDNRAALVSFDFRTIEPIIGPFTLAAIIDAEHRLYDSSPYSSEGRQDTRGGLSFILGAPDWNYYGFAPTITLDVSRTRSNIDIYDSRNVGISIGVESVF